MNGRSVIATIRKTAELGIDMEAHQRKLRACLLEALLKGA